MFALFFAQFLCLHEIPYGLAVRIRGFHPAGPGSTSGMGILVFTLYVYKVSRCLS